MRNTPLHESHLLEAVRRKILSSDQMEQVLALARSIPAEGAVADVRWATVVQGLIAAAAVMGSGLGILIDTSDHGADLGTAAYGAVGVAASLGLAAFLHRYTWGRVPGSIVRAGAAVWSFALALGLLSLVLPLRPVGYAADFYASYDAFRERLNLGYALAGGASAGFAVVLWRTWRCAPAVGVAGGHVALGAMMLMTSRASPMYSSAPTQALGLLCVGGALFALAAALDRRPRGAVDGTFWLYPVALFPMGCAAVVRIDRHEGEVFVWLPLALALGAVAYAGGRRFPLLFTAVAAVAFPTFALAEAHAPAGVVLGSLVACSALVAVAVHVVRARDLRGAAAPGDAPSIWG